MKTSSNRILPALVLAAALGLGSARAPAAPVVLLPVGTYTHGTFDGGAAEIAAYEPLHQRVFVVNGEANTIDILDIADPTTPTLYGQVDLAPYGDGPTSVAFNKSGLGAVAVVAAPKTDPGTVLLIDPDGAVLAVITVGALPDMVTFTPDGTRVLVANEGEPSDDYTIDPEGTVSIIDVSAGPLAATVTTIDFTGYNGMEATLNASGIRIFGPNATAAQDLEPEYIAVAPDNSRAWVGLQENNALALIDLASSSLVGLVPLGFKDHLQPSHGLDASDKDDAINIRPWPVLGMYQPDGIAAFMAEDGEMYLILANEGDSRDYDGFSEETRIGDIKIDEGAFKKAYKQASKRHQKLLMSPRQLQRAENLGRLKITATEGITKPQDYQTNPQKYANAKKDPRHYGQFYSFGARSFSIRRADAALIYDSGNVLEFIQRILFPDYFNASNDNQDFDNRSDDKGPEPECVTVGEVNGRQIAFVGLERCGGIAVYDVTEPHTPEYQVYVNNRDFTADLDLDPAAAKDLGPEGLAFIPANESPTGVPLLVVANEVSGTTTLYEIVEDL